MECEALAVVAVTSWPSEKASWKVTRLEQVVLRRLRKGPFLIHTSKAKLSLVIRSMAKGGLLRWLTYEGYDDMSAHL